MVFAPLANSSTTWVVTSSRDAWLQDSRLVARGKRNALTSHERTDAELHAAGHRSSLLHHRRSTTPQQRPHWRSVMDRAWPGFAGVSSGSGDDAWLLLRRGARFAPAVPLGSLSVA